MIHFLPSVHIGFVMLSCLLFMGCGEQSVAEQENVIEESSRHPYLQLDFAKKFTIDRGDGGQTVPDNCVWEISGHDIAQGSVSTSDIHVEGRASIGGYEIEGTYWLTFQQLQNQTLWVYSGTVIGLGDTRPSLHITEYTVLDRE